MKKETENFTDIVENDNINTRMAISDTINSDIVDKMKSGFDRLKDINSPNIIDTINCTSLNLADKVDYVKLAANIAGRSQTISDTMEARYFDSIISGMLDANETASDMYTLYMVELFLIGQFNILYSRVEYEFEWFDDDLKSKIKGIASSLPMKILRSINRFFDINSIKYYWQCMFNETDTEDDRRDKLESAIAPSLNLFMTDTMAGLSMVICDTIYAHLVTEISPNDFDLILKDLSPFLTDFRNDLLDFIFAVVRELVLYRATVDKNISERVKSLSEEMLGDDYNENGYYPL